MCDHHHNQGRREALKVFGALGLAGLGTPVLAANAATIGAFMPGKGWMPAGASCEGDGTPLQFIPRTAPDANPLVDELKKYPKCPYCGMDRAKFAHSRVLVDYEGGSAFGACSLHCAAVDMAVHIDKTPKAIMVGDYNTKKLIDAEKGVVPKRRQDPPLGYLHCRLRLGLVGVQQELPVELAHPDVGDQQGDHEAEQHGGADPFRERAQLGAVRATRERRVEDETVSSTHGRACGDQQG